MPTQYSLTVINQSQNLGDFCVYQTAPDIDDPNVFSLAWFTKKAQPTTKVKFTWTIDYSFIWSETGTLVPGVMFDASQVWDADLSTKNQVTLTNDAGAFTFENLQAGPKPGTLSIKQDATIPFNTAAAGIGMSGAGTFVVQAQPNYTSMFSPHPKYWVTFGSFEQGEVLDITQIVSQSAEIDFPVNVYSMTAILQADNTWLVQPTKDVNAAYVAARERNERAAWGEVHAGGRTPLQNIVVRDGNNVCARSNSGYLLQESGTTQVYALDAHVTTPLTQGRRYTVSAQNLEPLNITYKGQPEPGDLWFKNGPPPGGGGGGAPGPHPPPPPPPPPRAYGPAKRCYSMRALALRGYCFRGLPTRSNVMVAPFEPLWPGEQAA